MTAGCGLVSDWGRGISANVDDMTGIRSDRIATLYLFHPLLRLMPAGRVKVPILMYHSISENNNGDSSAYYQTTTTPEVFAEQMKFLHENSFRVTNLGEALKIIERAEDATPRHVVITFDDGFRDFYTHAFPVLTRYGFSATVFLPTAFINESGSNFKGGECLTWTQVRELKSAGVLFGSHTVNHPQLTTVKPRQLEVEVRESKRVIEDKLGCPVESFAYPYAFPETDRTFKRRLRSILEGAGYMNGVSTIIGTAGSGADRFFLPRLPVNSWDDLQLFRAKLEAGYDWLHLVQLGSKLIRARFA
jgi:peptidoglycan/xylan/chitin deacetylase (PgdA/CDA1 family)